MITPKKAKKALTQTDRANKNFGKYVVLPSCKDILTLRNLMEMDTNFIYKYFTEKTLDFQDHLWMITKYALIINIVLLPEQMKYTMKITARHVYRRKNTRKSIGKLEDPVVVCLTADIQKVLVLPKLTTKQDVFVSRLVTFNETFASKTASFPNYSALWHEAIAARKAPDVALTYLKIIRIIDEQDMSNPFYLSR